MEYKKRYILHYFHAYSFVSDPVLIGVILGTFFYLFKPIQNKDDKDNCAFRRWWVRGRYFLLCLSVITLVSILSLIALSNVYISMTSFTASKKIIYGVKHDYIMFQA